MNGKRKLLSVSMVLVALLLSSCVPKPLELSINDEPRIAKEGQTVVYTIKYKNNDQENSLGNVVVVLDYDKYLSFNQDAIPFPDEIDEKQRKLEWKLGKLAPLKSDVIEVEFRLASEIPLAVYELEITAEISSPDVQDSNTESEETLIEGHPTPTPKPTNTPKPRTPTP